MKYLKKLYKNKKIENGVLKIRIRNLHGKLEKLLKNQEILVFTFMFHGKFLCLFLCFTIAITISRDYMFHVKHYLVFLKSNNKNVSRETILFIKIF